MSRRSVARVLGCVAVAAMGSVSFARADGPGFSAGPADAPAEPQAAPRTDVLPPWSDLDDLPIPSSAESVVPHRADEALFDAPSKSSHHRGSALLGTHMPLFGAKRGPGCEGRWLLVGPLAWLCSDNAEYSPVPASSPPPRAADDGLPYRYYFVGRDGAYGYQSLSHVDEDAPDGELQPGFAVAVVDEKVYRDDRWLRTRSGYWLRARELGAARPSPFHGELFVDARAGEPLDVAWVTADRTVAFAEPRAGKPMATLDRLQRVHFREEKTVGNVAWVRTSEDGAPPRWMRAKDLTHPTPAPPPTEPGFDAATERWIDVDLSTQTLTAYEGARPVFATLVSGGRGAPGTDAATPPGAHRIWVKLLSTNMDNLENDDAEQHYSIEDVPYVQFFDNAVALHGAFWHRAFGRPFSHGCVNLAPKDAKWLFGFTSPHLPAGWSAAMPVTFEKGTLVRVR